jgi:hypothetical protein
MVKVNKLNKRYKLKLVKFSLLYVEFVCLYGTIQTRAGGTTGVW